jgi:hypothetical protein
VYATCLFCHTPLGENTAIEMFPVGHRLAFDHERGRLWVICQRCERWNLSPIEERWEAIEHCEELFRASRLRACTSNIGLARVQPDFELVRIGRPLLPEMAAWRYGDQFGRRRRRYIWYGVGALAVAGGALIGGAIAGASVVATGLAGNAVVSPLREAWRYGHIAVRVPVGDGVNLAMTRAHLREVELRLEVGDRWSLGMPHRHWGYTIPTAAGRRHIGPFTWVEGPAARRVAAQILPLLNRRGGSGRRLRDAVGFLETHGTGDQAFLGVLGSDHSSGIRNLHSLPRAVRLALEMAANEEIERQFLEGDLKELEDAWREAEEIAAIADNLLVDD